MTEEGGRKSLVLWKGTLPGFYYVPVYDENGVKRVGNNPITEHGAASSSVLTARRPSLGSGRLVLVLPRLVLVLPRLVLVLSSAGAASLVMVLPRLVLVLPRLVLVLSSAGAASLVLVLPV